MVKVSANELLSIINNQWAGTNEIMKVGCVGKNQALKIKREIKRQLELNGYYLPKNLVTMESVLNYFKINIHYLKKVSENKKDNAYE